MTLKKTIETMVANGYKLKEDAGKIQFSIKKYDTDVRELKLPTRAENAIARNHIKTIGELIDYFSGGIQSLKGIGTKTIKETKLAIIEWYWNQLDEKGRAAYLQTLFA